MFDTLYTFVDTMQTYYPENVYLYYYKALYFLKKQMPQQALNYIAIGEKYNVNDFRAKALFYYTRYLAYYLKNNTETTEKYYLLAMNNINRDCYNLAYFIFINSMLNIDLQRVGKLSPPCDNYKNYQEIAFMYAFYYYRISDLVMAEEMILKSLKIEPNNPLYNEMAYYIYSKKGDNQKAEKYKNIAQKTGSQFLFLKDEKL